MEVCVQQQRQQRQQLQICGFAMEVKRLL
jgi:hypothetical protein